LQGKKISFLALLLTLLASLTVFPQDRDKQDDSKNRSKDRKKLGEAVRTEIVSVNDIKQVMSDRFSSVKDYTGDFKWVNGESHYSGKIRYKKPDKILLTFDDPQDQKIVSNGSVLYIYVPYLKVVVQQTLGESTESALLASSSEAGLEKLFDEYAFSFYDSSALQPYKGTLAHHLKLSQKTAKVGFKRMDLWVSEDGLILQANGVSPNGISVSLIFSNVQLNTELPDYIFDFEVPADAQIIRNLIVPFSDDK
jgi:outer membrane lipoprotein-sorting protein